MISIDEPYVDSAAPNADAAKNGRALVMKKSFVALNISADKQVIFGQCQGSGKTPYECSCDFARPENPVYRCSCPSRQFPCKHCIGLMYAYTKNAAKTAVRNAIDALIDLPDSEYCDGLIHLARFLIERAQ